MRNYPGIGIQVPDVLLPKKGTNLTQWAVIACDQFTSEPEYWQQVQQTVGDSPSTYNLILPEVYLGKPEETSRIASTQQAMRAYLQKGILVNHQGMILVERTVGGKTRRGIMLALDLEQYDYNKGSQSLIRATEGTILDRLPPRIKIRQGATLELPHILVLIDDPLRTVIEPITQQAFELPLLYDFDLMFNSGHLTGRLINRPDFEAQVIRALQALADPLAFQEKYGVDRHEGVLLFAMGDGNHSLATAKAIWENIKGQVGMNHPARYALVEIENVHDHALEFEPIHRVLFEVKQDIVEAMQSFYGREIHFKPADSMAEVVQTVDEHRGDDQAVGIVYPGYCGVAYISHPSSNLPVGTLQAFLDNFLKQDGAGKIDYVHGKDVVERLGNQPGHAGFYVPGMDKSDLFKTVIKDGALPRKTFSMGEAHEKRFYMECRKIA